MTKFSPEYLSLAGDLLSQFSQTQEDSLSAVLTDDNLEAFKAQYAGSRVRRFPPLKTLTLFMHQVAGEHKSCRNTLIANARDQVAAGRELDKTGNSAYCKARQRLTEESVEALFTQSGENLDAASPESCRWHNRRVVITDGSTLSMPDTIENQQAYPQHGGQKKGVGFPILRIEILSTLGSGAILGSAVAAYQGKRTGETALFRKLMVHLKSNDILLGDAIFENYFLIAQLQLGGVDVVFEKNGARQLDLRQCDQKLGKKDGLIRLTKPPRPDWMDRDYYNNLVPSELTIRVVKSKKRIIVTTLLDAEKYPRSEIVSLYQERWHVELDFRAIKSLMKMDVLRCKTPEMVRKEIHVHLLVYNLIRALMARAALQVKNQPREISFKAAQETLQEFHVLLLQAETILLSRLTEYMILIAGEHIVGNRPGRTEPRAVKRRPKPYKRLQHSRAQARRLKVYQRQKA